MELKPCPFCGGEARLYQSYDGFWVVQCIGCACGTLFFKDKEFAIERWNRRTP